MVFAQHGAPHAQAERVAGNLFGGADFLEESFAYSPKKIGGTENPRAIRLRAGVVCAMSERKGSRRCLDADNTAAQGIKQSVFDRAAAGDRAESAAAGEAPPEEFKGEALRRGNVSAGDGSRRRAVYAG
jgi:hypothetical protein